MMFHSINKFAFVSDCQNYMITISNAGKQLLYACHRVNQDDPNKWDNISENNRSYLTYQAATTRIQHIHKSEPEKAYKIPPHLRDRATPYQAQSSMNKIKGFLK